MLPEVQAFPSASQQAMAVVVKFEMGRAFGIWGAGMARVERTAQGSCFQAAVLGLAMGIYRSQKRRGKKNSGHNVAGHMCFLGKITTQTAVCIVVPIPGGANSQKWGTGAKQRVSKG